ncbi:MAG: hypothetical protein IID33_11625, partial [Planctomycetes bacterium]|nr:hypothetical protein [Planctomycetota bacterium]
MSGTSALLGWIDRQNRPADRQSPRRAGANSTTDSSGHALSLQQIERLVQSVVAEASQLRSARWESVDVLAGPAVPGVPGTVAAYSKPMLLTAKPTRKQVVPDRAGRANKPTVSTYKQALPVGLATQFHFRIDPHGRPFATDAWIRQVALAKDPYAIAIQVTRPGEGQAMTPSQWQCVRSLISELSTLPQSRRADVADR